MESLYPNAQHLLRVANENDLTDIKSSIDAASDWDSISIPSQKSKLLLFMSHLLRLILLLALK